MSELSTKVAAAVDRILDDNFGRRVRKLDPDEPVTLRVHPAFWTELEADPDVRTIRIGDACALHGFPVVLDGGYARGVIAAQIVLKATEVVE